MEIENIFLLNEITNEECATVMGGDGISGAPGVTLPVGGVAPTATTTTGTSGTTVNFDLNSYLFRVGAGAIFDGGLTTNVVNLAFQGAIFTRT